MQKMKIKEIKKALSAELLIGDPEVEIKNIVIDSREVETGDLFIALIGDNDDGHNYLEDAAANGASAVIVENLSADFDEVETTVLKVEDTTEALQQLAAYYRRKHKNLKVVAVTGSAGKTTTKDMTAAVLAQKYNTLKTKGNYNNHIGLPLTLLSLNGEEDYAVVEMGMSGFGEIELLAEIASPDTGIVTNVGPAHLKQLGSLENIAKAKRELVDSLDKYGTAFLNYDNQYTRKMGDDYEGRVIYYGFEKGADLRIISHDFNKEEFKQQFEVEYLGKEYNFYIKKPGKHNIYNALAAVGIGLENQLSSKEIQKGLLEADFTSLRMEILELDNNIKLINDCYNANPLSVKAAADVLSEFEAERRIAVLSSMLELGPKSDSAHRNIGSYIYQKNIDLLLTVGSEAELIAEGAAEAGMDAEKIFSFANNEQTADFLETILLEKDVLLVKGSRANKMEEIAEKLMGKELN